jgi:predicted nucleotidyltransferase component of viral defense system
MTMGPITLTVGWISRHTPPGAGVDGRDAAVTDIAQDLLLRDLHKRGSLEALAFKGGTSLRKLYAGNQGRFSLDLDFSVADPATLIPSCSNLSAPSTERLSDRSPTA